MAIIIYLFMQLIKKGIHFLNKNLVCMHAQIQNMEHGVIQTIFSISNTSEMALHCTIFEYKFL